MEDEAEKGAEAASSRDNDFLKKIESTMLSQVALQGIEGIRKVSLRLCTNLRVD